MLNPTAGPLRPRALIVDDALARPDTALGRAAESLAAALESRNVEVIRALSFEDGRAIVSTDASLGAVLLDWNLGSNDPDSHDQATALLHKLRERLAAVPVFLLADRELTRGSMTIEVAEMVDEFVWLLEDTADFVAGRVLAAIQRYQAQLLPPYARVLANYARLREHSWSAPGHQGGIAFTKHPAGRAFFDFLGENVFRIDMGIERGVLGSLLDHTGPVADQREICGAGLRGSSQLFGRRRHIRREPQHHAGMHEGGRPGRTRSQLPQIDRAGPDADRRAAGLYGADAEPLWHHRSDLPFGDGPQDDPQQGSKRAH